MQTVASLTKTNEEQGRKIAGLTAELKKMAAQTAWFQRQMYGRKSEKHIVIDSQPSLFDELETEAPSESREAPESREEEETLTYTRRKGQTGTTITIGRKNHLFCGNHESAENMWRHTVAPGDLPKPRHQSIPVYTSTP